LATAVPKRGKYAATKNTSALPARLARSQDHYGYYNEAITNNSLVPLPNSITSSSDFVVRKFSYTYGGVAPMPYICNREPNASYRDYGYLSKINYPMGGYTELVV
jgi:hypothetical protein